MTSPAPLRPPPLSLFNFSNFSFRALLRARRREPCEAAGPVGMEKAGREGESGCVRPPSPAACPPPARPGPLYNPPGAHTPSLPRPSLLTRTCLPSPGRGPADPQGSHGSGQGRVKGPQPPAPCPGEPLPCGDMNSKLVQAPGGGTGREEGGTVGGKGGEQTDTAESDRETEESEGAMGRRRRSEREGDSEKAGGLEKGRAEREMKGRIRDAETPTGQREAERNGDSQTETDECQGVIPKGPGPPRESAGTERRRLPGTSTERLREGN